jgi:adenylylsulfate kinase-like enzyme
MLSMVIDLTPNLPYDMRDRAEQIARRAAVLADLARYGAGSKPNRVSPISQSTTCLSAS